MAKESDTLQANFFLLFTCKKPTGMAVPWGAKMRKKRKRQKKEGWGEMGGGGGGGHWTTRWCKELKLSEQSSPDRGTSSPPADSGTCEEAAGGAGGAGGGGGGARVPPGLPDVSFLICLSWACTVLKVLEPIIIDICPPWPSTGAISCSKLKKSAVNRYYHQHYEY